jgi:hypothetical protein
MRYPKTVETFEDLSSQAVLPDFRSLKGGIKLRKQGDLLHRTHDNDRDSRAKQVKPNSRREAKPQPHYSVDQEPLQHCRPFTESTSNLQKGRSITLSDGEASRNGKSRAAS